MISTYNITTGMGSYNATMDGKLPFLTDNQLKEFNSIGYSGKTLDGKKMCRSEYLNSLGNGEYDVTQTKFDNGSFQEEFTIVWVH